MRNNILIAAILCVFSTAIFAKDAATDAPKSLFNCLNLDSYSVDANCSSSLISTNSEFVASQKELSLKMMQQNPNVMATVQFHPEQMLIKVIAQKEAEREVKTKLLAAARNTSGSPVFQ
ncbi:MAG: hypothetical protein ABJK37_17860 [Paraglaciecola sp.]|uniref:hypothetical protein n=1 Tax=Paraglaciecola sp. TaxID=1920173 RepID=UPI003298B785